MSSGPPAGTDSGSHGRQGSKVSDVSAGLTVGCSDASKTTEERGTFRPEGSKRDGVTAVSLLRQELLAALERHHQDMCNVIDRACSEMERKSARNSNHTTVEDENGSYPAEVDGDSPEDQEPLGDEQVSEFAQMDSGSTVKGGNDHGKECCCFGRPPQNSFIHTLTEGTVKQAPPGSLRAKLDRKLGTQFDLCIGCLVVLNTVLMFIQLEVEAPHPDKEVPKNSIGFVIINHIFNAIFVCELLLKISVKQGLFFTSFFNWMDAAIVLTTSIDVYILSSLNTGQNISFMRMVRFVRVVRALRVIRTMGLFRQLRVLLNTIAMSFMSLFWSMILFFIFMLMFSLLLCQVLQGYVEDTANDVVDRRWVHTYYGTSTRSLYTVFELTFSGCWPNYVRKIVEDVESTYAIFFIVYVTAVVFAMVRIISALFLKDTLQAAANDADMVVQEKLKEMKAVQGKLKEIFEEADKSKDGFLSRDELDVIMAYPKVKIWLNVFGLDVSETNTLFEMLDGGDGRISHEEFVGGIMRLKGTSRSQDTISIMRDCQRICRSCDAMQHDLKVVQGSIESLQMGTRSFDAVATAKSRSMIPKFEQPPMPERGAGRGIADI